MRKRKVTVYSTKGGLKEIESTADVWKELKLEVEKYYDLSNLQATESVYKTSLIHDDALLPCGRFILFLRPVQIKAGMNLQDLTHKELRKLVNFEVKTWFKRNYITTKSWTQYTTEELKEGLTQFSKTNQKLVVSDKKKKEKTTPTIVDTIILRKEEERKQAEIQSELASLDKKLLDLENRYKELLKGFHD